MFGFNLDIIDIVLGMILFMWVVICGKDDIVRFLLKKGVGVNID